MLNTEKHKMKE